MTILSPAEVARERLNQGPDAANDLAWFIRPIYGASEATRPMHIGTALLLDLARGPQIPTVAYAVDWAAKTTLCLGLHTTIELPRTFLAAAASDGDRLADVVLVAIAPFPVRHLGSLGGAGFFPKDRIGDRPGSSVGRSFTCIEFPNSPNRTLPRSRPKYHTAKGLDIHRYWRGRVAAAEAGEQTCSHSGDLRLQAFAADGWTPGGLWEPGRHEWGSGFRPQQP